MIVRIPSHIIPAAIRSVYDKQPTLPKKRRLLLDQPIRKKEATCSKRR